MEKFKINLGEDIANNSISITGYRLGQGSPSIYIQGGIHAGEITYWIFQELIKKLSKQKLNGSITLIPLANPFTWNDKNYFYTHGKFSSFDGVDWNRHFPGSKEGDLGKILAHHLFEEAKKHNLVVDLHTSRTSEPFGIYVSQKDKGLIKTLGLKYNQFLDTETSGKAGTLNHACNNSDIRSIAIECGTHDSYEKENIDLATNALLSLLIDQKIIEGDIKKEESIYSFQKLKTYYAPKSGFIKFIHPLDKPYKEGDTLYTISPSDNLEEELEIKAKENGIMFKYSPTHIFHFGHPVIQTIPENNLEKI